MSVTARLGITLLDVAQAQKEVTINSALSTIDTGVAVLAAANTFTGSIKLTRTAVASGNPSPDLWTVAPADTGLTASTEAIDVLHDFSATRQFATGALTNQRAMRIIAPTYSFVGASTITTAATVSISGPPIAGTNATITTPWALNVESGNVNVGGTIAAAGATLTGNLTLSAHNLVTDTVTGTQIGTGPTQLLGFYGATPTAQVSGSTDILTGLITQGLRGAGANPNLNIGTGTVTAAGLIVTTVAFIGTTEIGNSGIQGNAPGMLQLLYKTASYAVDANITLLTSISVAGVLVVSSTVSLTATRNLVFPTLTQGGIVLVTNKTTGGQSIQVIGTSGTGVTITNGKSALVYCDGTNFVRATADA